MRWVVLAVAVVGQLIALYSPGSPDPGIELFPHADKVVHVLLFAVPTALARWCTPRWWPVILLALHAPVSELVQWRLVPLRSGDPWDLVADLAGIALGLLAGATLRRG